MILNTFKTTLMNNLHKISLLALAIISLLTGCIKERLTPYDEHPTPNFPHNYYGYDTPKDTLERVFGDATVSFSVEPGDTVFVFGEEEAVFECLIDGDPDAVDIWAEYDQYIYLHNIENWYFQGTSWMPYHKEGNKITFSHLMKQNRSVNGICTTPVMPVRIKVTPVESITTYPDGTKEKVTGEPRVFQFYMTTYQVRDMIMDYDNMEQVYPVTEGKQTRKPYPGYTVGGRAGQSVTVDGIRYVTNTQIPGIDLAGATRIELDETAGNVPDWVTVDGLTITTTQDNNTGHYRYCFFEVVMDKPFEGCTLDEGDRTTDGRYRDRTHRLLLVQEPVMDDGDGYVRFKDPELKYALIKRNTWNIDTDGDGKITFDEARNTKVIDIEPGFYNITDATGLEAFENVETFRMMNNDIKDLSVIGTFRKLKRLNIADCDKLDCHIDFRNCPVVFFEFYVPSYAKNLKISKYKNQVFAYQQFASYNNSIDFYGYHDPYESTDFSGEGEIHLYRKSQEESDINFCIVPNGFVDKDYEDGTIEDLMEYIIHAYENGPVAPYVKKINFYYYKHICTTRWAESKFEIEISGEDYVNAKAYGKWRIDDRNEIVKPIYEYFCPGQEDNANFRLLVSEFAIGGTYYSYNEAPFWFWYFNRYHRAYGYEDCPGNTPMSTIRDEYITPEEKRYGYINYDLVHPTKWTIENPQHPFWSGQDGKLTSNDSYNNRCIVEDYVN